MLPEIPLGVERRQVTDQQSEELVCDSSCEADHSTDRDNEAGSIRRSMRRKDKHGRGRRSRTLSHAAPDALRPSRSCALTIRKHESLHDLICFGQPIHNAGVGEMRQIGFHRLRRGGAPRAQRRTSGRKSPAGTCRWRWE